MDPPPPTSASWTVAIRELARAVIRLVLQPRPLEAQRRQLGLVSRDAAPAPPTPLPRVPMRRLRDAIAARHDSSPSRGRRTSSCSAPRSARPSVRRAVSCRSRTAAARAAHAPTSSASASIGHRHRNQRDASRRPTVAAVVPSRQRSSSLERRSAADAGHQGRLRCCCLPMPLLPDPENRAAVGAASRLPNVERRRTPGSADEPQLPVVCGGGGGLCRAMQMVVCGSPRCGRRDGPAVGPVNATATARSPPMSSPRMPSPPLPSTALAHDSARGVVSPTEPPLARGV